MLTLIISYHADGDDEIFPPIQFTTRDKALDYIRKDMEKYFAEQGVPMVQDIFATQTDLPLGDTHYYSHSSDDWRLEKMGDFTDCSWTLYEPKVDPDYPKY